MSSEKNISHEDIFSESPSSGHHIPFPFITRRNRRTSVNERAAAGPEYTGTISSFCRKKGHGFIKPNGENTEPIFVHVTDIEGEFVPHIGDSVSYKTILCPPKEVRPQAVHVRIINFSPGHHETWSDPVAKENDS